MSQQQEEVEMKTMNKDEVENEEDSGSEYTGSEYTEEESESEARGTDSEDDEPETKEKTKEKNEESNTIKKKPVGLLIERPVGWTTKGVIPSKLGFRKTRGLVLTFNVLLALLSICAIQVICLYRDMCSNSDDPTVPDVVGLSIVPLSLIAILLVCPVSWWSTVSRLSSKVWRYHLFLSASYAVTLVAMVIVGAVEYLDIMEIRSCVEPSSSGANCTGWDELSAIQRNRFQNDKSIFETEINKNGAAIGIFACLGCLICILDVIISACLLCSGADEDFDDDDMDLPSTTLLSGGGTLGRSSSE